MSISRPFLLALLGAALLGATFFAVQNARNDSSEPVAPAAQQAAPEQQTAQAPSGSSGLSAQDALAAAFAGDQKVESGKFNFRLSAEDFKGVPQINGAAVEIAGRFQGQGTKDVPKFDIDMKITEPGGGIKVGAISTGDEGFLTNGKKAYAVPAAVMGEIADARTEIAGYAGDPQPKLSVGGFDVGGWVTDPKVVGTEQMDGIEVTHVAGKLDAGRFVDGIAKLGPASSLPEGDYLDQVAKNKAALRRLIGEPDVDVYVGEDHIMRRLQVAADLNLAAAGEGAGGPRDGKVRLDVRLSDVNEPQTITAPASTSKVPLQRGFERVEAINAAGILGVGALMVEQPGLAGARASGFDFSELAGSASLTDNPQRAARAVKAGKKVVILFQNPEALDDRAVLREMATVSKRTGAVVLVDHVDAVDRYGKLVEDLGVSQTPSVVLVDRTGNARLIEGYVDTDTLTQAVADAR